MVFRILSITAPMILIQISLIQMRMGMVMNVILMLTMMESPMFEITAGWLIILNSLMLMAMGRETYAMMMKIRTQFQTSWTIARTTARSMQLTSELIKLLFLILTGTPRSILTGSSTTK